MESRELEVLCFDVFGTVVDWRSSLIAELTAFGQERRLEADWAGLVDDWRAGYQPAMERVRSGERPWVNLDVLHRERLDELLPRYGLEGLDEADRARLTNGWHRLEPWPDSVPGIGRLAERYILAPLSNGSVALLTNMAKRAGLPWDLVLSTELCRQYKPRAETYRMPAELLQRPPGRIMMVAAHNDDLVAAASHGLRTAFVRRATEYGPRQRHDFEAEHDFDVVAEDMEDLAAQLLGPAS